MYFFLLTKAAGAVISFKAYIIVKEEHIFVFWESNCYRTGCIHWFDFLYKTFKVASKFYNHNVFPKKNIFDTIYSGFFSLQIGMLKPREIKWHIQGHIGWLFVSPGLFDTLTKVSFA